MSIFVCYVGKPYMQIIRPKTCPDEADNDVTQMTHELIFFDLSPVLKDNISIGDDTHTPLKYGDIITTDEFSVGDQKAGTLTSRNW